MAIAKRRIKIEGTYFPYDDAKKDVSIKRTLVDVWKGKPGSANECMNAQCVMRNKRKFGHKVLGVSVIKSRVYILDSPDHVIRYTLSERDSRLIAQHDEEALGQPGTLVLRAPRGHNKAGAVHSTKRGRSGQHNPSSKKQNHPMALGEKARVMAAVGAGRD